VRSRPLVALALTAATAFLPLAGSVTTAGADSAPRRLTGSTEGVVAARSAYGDAPVSMERVVVPMVFPVLGGASWSDTFLACRSGCTRKHFGQDLMGPKMRPLLAAFDGVVSSVKRETKPGEGNYLTILGDNGFGAMYIHVNNDTPGTDDGRGTASWAFAPGLRSGQRVVAGQHVAWLGDSGNAEGTAPHLHFELRKGGTWSGTVVNAAPSLRAASHLARARVSGPHPDGTLIQPDTGGAVWVLEDGHKRVVPDGVLLANGWTRAQVVRVSRSEVDAYPRRPDLRVRDGAVVKDPTGAIWVVVGGRRIPVPDAAALALVGVRADRVRAVDARTLATVPLAASDTPLPGPVRPGALVREVGKPEVWFVEGERRRHVPDRVTLTSWGYSLSDVWDVPAGTLASESASPSPSPSPQATAPSTVSFGRVLGAPWVVRDGTLLRHSRTGWVWLMSKGEKRHVTSGAALRAFGYGTVPMLTVAPQTLDRQPSGPAWP
jgi:hypothetical protein